MQGTPTPVNRAATKGVRPKSKKASKTNSLPGDKVVSKNEMHFAIKALLLQKILNVKMKEWGKITIKVALTLNPERQTVMHVIKDVVNDRDGKPQEGMKDMDTSWEGLTLSI